MDLTSLFALARWLCRRLLAHRSEDGLRALANVELRSREAVVACTAARLAAAARIEKVTTQLGEAIIASGRELLAAGDLEVEAASLAKASPLGAEAEVRLSISLCDCSTESAVVEEFLKKARLCVGIPSQGESDITPGAVRFIGLSRPSISNTNGTPKRLNYGWFSQPSYAVSAHNAFV